MLFSKENKMKHTNLFRLVGILSLLVSLAASPASVMAATPAQSTGPIATIHVDSMVMSLTTTNIAVGSTVTYAIDLQNLPAEGLTSAEFSCTYNATIVEVSNIVKTNMFGSDAVTAINGPASGTFVFAIAGVTGKATTGGTVFKLDMKGLTAGSFSFSCTVRASKDGSSLFSITFTPATITVAAASTNGTVSGTVTAATKPVTVTLYSGTTVVTSATASAAGAYTFSLTAAAGTYKIVASSSGYLDAQNTSITLTTGGTQGMATITLYAGDINHNGSVEALDVSTIGTNYNLTTPTAADLNNDHIINVLDLQMLAPNWGKTTQTWAVAP